MTDRTMKILMQGLIMLSTGWLVSGCVVLEEKYNAEKARSLNFQRLLAQEEKRTAELDSEVKRTKKELAEFEARNRELTAQVQAAREQMARLQEETEAIKESALLERKAMEDMRKAPHAAAKTPAPAPPHEPATDLAGVFAKMAEEVPADAAVNPPAAAPAPAKTAQTVHVVKPGDTLYRIAKQYNVNPAKLKKWNNLRDDIIEVGQKLIIKSE